MMSNVQKTLLQLLTTSCLGLYDLYHQRSRRFVS